MNSVKVGVFFIIVIMASVLGSNAFALTNPQRIQQLSSTCDQIPKVYLTIATMRIAGNNETGIVNKLAAGMSDITNPIERDKYMFMVIASKHLAFYNDVDPMDADSINEYNEAVFENIKNKVPERYCQSYLSQYVNEIPFD